MNWGKGDAHCASPSFLETPMRCAECVQPDARDVRVWQISINFRDLVHLERARRFERPTLTLARLCSTPELRPLPMAVSGGLPDWVPIGAGEAIRTPDPNLGKVMLYP